VTAPAAVAAVVVAAAGGLALGAWPFVRERDGAAFLRALRPGLAVGAALFVFAIWAAPVVLSGEATWAGYNKLNDLSTWLSLVDQALAHGRTVSDLPPSTYSLILSHYLTVGYPIGSFLPLGLGHALLGIDIAWLADPWMAFSASMLAVALYGCARRTLPRTPTWHASVIAALASVSTLLYGYYLWGGIKEQVSATLIATAAVTAPLVLGGRRRVRAGVPAALVVWAIIASLSPGGLIWIGPGGLIALAVVGLRTRLMPASAPVTPAGVAPPAQAPVSVDATKAPTRSKPAAKATVKAPSKPPSRATRRSSTKTPAPAASRATRKSVRAGAAEPRRRRRPRTPARERPDGALTSTRGAVDRLTERFQDLDLVAVGALAGLVAVAVGALLVLRSGGFVETFKSILTGSGQLGSLRAPLNPLQAAGIWFNGDFRYGSAHRGVVYALIALVLVAAAFAFVVAVRRARWELVLYELFALAGAAVALLFGSPWVAGKALASAAPALPFAALVAASLLARRQIVGGAIVAALVAGGILWGDALSYHDVQLAPRSLYAALASIAPRVGPGPTFMPEYSDFATSHFLRASAPENPQDRRSRLDPLINGRLLPSPAYIDLDAFELNYTLLYPTIVLQSSPVLTRPAEPYQLVAENQDWQVWQRPQTGAPIVSTLPLGDTTSALRPAVAAPCRSVLALGRLANVSELVAAPATNPTLVALGGGASPRGWAHGAELWMHGDGRATVPFTVATAARYGLWLEGSVQNEISLTIDGRRVGSVHDAEQGDGQFVWFGSVALSPGRHVAVLRHSAGWLSPGSGFTDQVGPLVLAPDVPEPALIRVPAADAGLLCGRALSWIEALAA